MDKARLSLNAPRLVLSLGLVIGLLAGPGIAAAKELGGSGKIKCWHNKDGVRECGNTVPPEYAQQESEVKDSSGLTVKTQQRAKTQEELEAERAAAKAKADEEAVEKERQKRDRVLLDTYASEDDLLLSRDGQINQLDSQVRQTNVTISKLQKNLDTSIGRAADAERKGEKPSKELTDNIDSVRKQIADNQRFIETKHKEQQEILDRFAGNIKRFRELKGMPVDAPIPAVKVPEPSAPPDFSKMDKKPKKKDEKKK